MGKVRGIRFTDKEEAQIEEFLVKNPLLDFSTMGKLAILEFIKNPIFSLTPVDPNPAKKEHKNVRTI
jgi:dolichyl-phosphate-mannose--protein O-mannosyl transferase